MFSKFKSAALSGKDSILSTSVKKLVNLKAGKMHIVVDTLHIDSQNKSISVSLDLNDGMPLLQINAYGYRITEKNEKFFLEVNTLQKSREWENSYIDGKRYKIPPEIVKVVKTLL